MNKHPAIPCSKTYNPADIDKFKWFINEDYRYNLYLDGLPAAVRLRDPQTGELDTNYMDGILDERFLRNSLGIQFFSVPAYKIS